MRKRLHTAEHRVSILPDAHRSCVAEGTRQHKVVEQTIYAQHWRPHRANPSPVIKSS
jgi:hypothetical protein